MPTASFQTGHEWSHRRELRSTVTMMRYLARTSNQLPIHSGELRPVVNVADRKHLSTRALILRAQQEQVEAELQTSVQAMAAALEADAQLRSRARAVAAAATKQAGWRAEHAARVMGAVAPHRPAAMGAALAVVAPSDAKRFHEGSSPPCSPTILRSVAQSIPMDHQPILASLLDVPGENGSIQLQLRSTTYLLRSCWNLGLPDGRGARLADQYLGYKQNPPRPEVLQHQLCTFAEAANAPWTLRQQCRSGACYLSSGMGSRLFSSPAGELALASNPNPELTHFLLLPLTSAEAEIASILRATNAGADAPPESASEEAVGRPRSAASQVEEGPEGDKTDRVLVRLYHPPSQSFLSVDPQTLRVQMKSALQVRSVAESLARHKDGHWNVVFELQPQSAENSPRRSTSANAVLGAAKHITTQKVERTLPKSPRASNTTLPVLGFNMSTGKAEALRVKPKASSLRVPAPNSAQSDWQRGRSHAPEGVPTGSAEREVVARRQEAVRSRGREPVSGWDPKDLDLKPVLAQGPIVFGDLLGLRAGPTSTSSMLGLAPGRPGPTRPLAMQEMDTIGRQVRRGSRGFVPIPASFALSNEHNMTALTRSNP